MKNQILSEARKFRTTRTMWGLLLGTCALVVIGLAEPMIIAPNDMWSDARLGEQLLSNPAAMAITLAVGIPWLEVRGGSITTSIPRVAGWVGLLMVMGALWSTMGVAVGLAVRHQVATIVGALVWVLFAEALVGAVAGDGVRKLLPASAGRAIAIQEPALLNPITGALVLSLWALAALCVGALLMRGRDIP